MVEVRSLFGRIRGKKSEVPVCGNGKSDPNDFEYIPNSWTVLSREDQDVG